MKILLQPALNPFVKAWKWLNETEFYSETFLVTSWLWAGEKLFGGLSSTRFKPLKISLFGSHQLVNVVNKEDSNYCIHANVLIKCDAHVHQSQLLLC